MPDEFFRRGLCGLSGSLLNFRVIRLIRVIRVIRAKNNNNSSKLKHRFTDIPHKNKKFKGKIKQGISNKLLF